ncbi:MAG: hypothetical protein IH892_05420 [Planctomycetes bacterium]|nr:hypothetical protein [Planctomycetota bacterium]
MIWFGLSIQTWKDRVASRYTKKWKILTTGQNDFKNIGSGRLEKTLVSWTEFVDFVKDPKQSFDTLIYRGQANAEWKVTFRLDS